jgi:hypothetical protein
MARREVHDFFRFALDVGFSQPTDPLQASRRSFFMRNCERIGLRICLDILSDLKDGDSYS